MTGVPVNHGTVDDAKLIAPCIPGPGITQFVELGLSNAPYAPVDIQCNVDEKTAMVIQEHASDWPGVGVDVQAVRDYPTGSLTADVIGFLGPIPASEEQFYLAQNFLPNRDKVGYAGVELTMNSQLMGNSGPAYRSIARVDVLDYASRARHPGSIPRLKRALAGEHLIEHQAQRVDIATLSHFEAGQLFRRHVGQSALRTSAPST